MNQHPKVSIVIVNAKGTKLLEAALLSIIKETHYDNYELIVVDCATPGFIHWINQFKRKYQGVTIKYAHFKDDIGASDEHNKALQLLDPDSEFVIFLDNDVKVIDPNWIDKLLDTVLKDKDIVASSPIIVDLNNENKIQWAGGYLLPHIETYEVSELTEIPNKYMYETFYFHGATFIIKRKALDEFRKYGLQMYHDFFFIGHDDIDLSIRLRSHGYKIVVSKKAKMSHKVSGTSSRLSSFRIYHWHKNALSIMFLNYKTTSYMIRATSLFLITSLLWTIRFRLNILPMLKAHAWFLKSMKNLIVLKRAICKYNLRDDKGMVREMYRILASNKIKFLGVKYRLYRHFLYSSLRTFL